MMTHPAGEDLRISGTLPLVSPAALDYRTRPLTYGRSVTDPCLAWEKTTPVLARLAASIQKRRLRTALPVRPAAIRADFRPPSLAHETVAVRSSV
jgi:hypothetical protein